MNLCPDCDGTMARGVCRSCGYSLPIPSTTKARRDPVCLRCGIVVPQARELFTICRECLDKDFAKLTEQAKKLQITAPLTRKENRDGQGDRPAGGLQAPSAGTLTPIRKVLADEPPF